MAADKGIFWLFIPRNLLNITLSAISKLPVLNLCRLMLLPFPSESKSFSLFLTQFDQVFFGTRYSAGTSLLLIPFSKSLRFDIFHVMFCDCIYVQ